MTPAEQFQAVTPRDAGDLASPERLAPILGAVGGLLLTVNSRDWMLKSAGAVLLAGSLYYGVATRPSETSGILDYDSKALDLNGPGYYRALYFVSGRGWSWAPYFQANSLSSALSTMRMQAAPGETQYMFRWLSSERRWGRVA